MSAAPDTVFDELRELQVRRKHFIKQQVSAGNRACALIRRKLGWHLGLSESDRSSLEKRSRAILAQALTGKYRPNDPFYDDLVADLEMVRQMLVPVRCARSAIEKQMRALARSLPVYGAFVAHVPGFGDLGLAVVVGECGDLANYASKQKVWKRCGLAPFKGKAASTWRRSGGLTKEEWTALGYAPRRLGEIFGCVTGSLVKAKAKSRYGARYTARRAHTAIAHPDWTKGHSADDAARCITKDLLADLWSVWTGAGKLLSESSAASMRPSALSQEERA